MDSSRNIELQSDDSKSPNIALITVPKYSSFYIIFNWIHFIFLLGYLLTGFIAFFTVNVSYECNDLAYMLSKIIYVTAIIEFLYTLAFIVMKNRYETISQYIQNNFHTPFKMYFLHILINRLIFLVWIQAHFLFFDQYADCIQGIFI